MRFVIVGAGIAGLFTAVLLRKKAPRSEIVIIEASERVGGRIFTKKYPDGSSFESGAGRFGMNHKTLMALFRRYNLTKDIIPISNEIQVQSGARLNTSEYRTTPPESILRMLVDNSRVNSQMMCEQTIEQLVRSLYGEDATRKVVHEFEYDSEIQIARAQTSLRAILETFRGSFGVLKGGFSRLVHLMKKDIQKHGGTILLGAKCTKIEPREDRTWDIEWRSRGSGIGGFLQIGNHLTADKVIMCTPRKVTYSLLANVIGIERCDVLYGENVFQDEPLLRVYARFPTSWIEKKVVTRKGIRYIIPVSSDPTIVMISYTDGPIARIWGALRKRVGDRECTRELMRQLRALFPRKNIPDPIWVSYEEWEVGATYWKPSSIDITSPKEQRMRMNPIPNVYVCGEFLSLYHQAWVEGALEGCLRVAKYSIQE
jgi:hypothetical protein